MKDGLILVADDDAAIRTVLSQALSRAGYHVRATSNASTLWNWVAAGDGDLVVTDVLMPDGSVFDMLPGLRRIRPEIPIIVMSAQNTFKTAIRASEQGAYEYLPKPFDLKDLTGIVARALAQPKDGLERRRTDGDGEDLPLVGRSPAMQEIYRLLARLMQNDLTVMITGESGTGKELVARALHDYGKRRNGPFVAVNMAALPRELIEVELFGQEHGSTDQGQTRTAGRFEQAEGGTLFLDEVGDMPMEAQTRLLRVVQHGEYTTPGGRTPMRSNVRIIATTNRDLRQLIGQGLFREDLYYRLNVVPIRLPPLRERIEDLPDLVQHFLRLAEQEGLAPKRIDNDALNLMRKYRWPGNIRELENLVRRLAALHAQDIISASIVEAELMPVEFPVADAASAESEPLGAAVERHMIRYFAEFGADLPPRGLYHRILREVEPPLLAAVLSATRGNQIRAAELLGLNRNTLRKKIRDHNIPIIKGGTS